MSYEVYGGLHSWLTPTAITLALGVMAFIYLRGWYRLRTDLPKVAGGWRFGAFMSGIVSMWAVLATPLAHLDHHSLTAHMVQHLLLMTVAAPLMLLGEPVIGLVHGLPRRYALAAAKELLPLAPAQRIFVYSVFCWLVGTLCV